jgi:hypothetical protein
MSEFYYGENILNLYRKMKHISCLTIFSFQSYGVLYNQIKDFLKSRGRNRANALELWFFVFSKHSYSEGRQVPILFTTNPTQTSWVSMMWSQTHGTANSMHTFSNLFWLYKGYFLLSPVMNTTQRAVLLWWDYKSSLHNVQQTLSI